MITTKGRYALRIMIDLAENRDVEFVPLKEIAERQDISKKYLEIIVKDLVRCGLVKGSSGKGGGYKLMKSPDDCTVLEIIEAAEGHMASVACLAEGADECPRATSCRTLPIWSELDKLTRDYLSSKKLSDLID